MLPNMADATLADAALKDHDTSSKRELLALIPELLLRVFEHCSIAELLALSLVSRRCRDFAAQCLYRDFSIIFPDDDDDLDDTGSSLAGCLNTFATSDYNYAQHLKQVSLETLSGGAKAERAYRHYHSSMNCGKFMNTLLFIALRRAKALETFRWDIRVEVSRQVFKALHDIPSLRHLHLRMQHGQSIYELPSSSNPPVPQNANTPTVVMIMGTPPPQPSIMQAPIYAGGMNHYMVATTETPKVHKKNVKMTHRKALKPPPTFSGFKNLHSLAILDLGTLDYLPEIKNCLDNSSLSLKSLKLSFSDGLVYRSKKPPAETQSDSDSEAEDEFGQPLPPVGGGSSGASEANIAMKQLKAQQEKKNQEAFLGKIFGLDKHKGEAKNAAASDKKPSPVRNGKDSRKAFVRSLVPLAQFLKSANQDASEKALDLILAASKKYLDTDADENSAKNGVQNDKNIPDVTKAASPSSIQNENGENPAVGLFDKPSESKQQPGVDPDAANPDDIDIDEPEDDLTNEEGEPLGAEASMDTEETLAVETETPKAPAESQVRDYIRSTRGLPLDSLALCLIPIRATVLTRAVDFVNLQKITLLNVGAQTPLWKMLCKDYDVSKLKLRFIYSDHISTDFLVFVSRLEAVEELLMLERSAKARDDDLAAKTTVSIENIRKAVLKKHADTLKVLMIRNDASHDWDLNIKTALLLCRRAKALEEFAVSYGVSTMHTMLQFLPGLTSLRALHTIHLRSHDTCPSITQEYRKFIVDIISHNPGMKLEYIGLDNCLDRVVIRKQVEPRAVNQDGKGKPKKAFGATLFSQLPFESPDGGWVAGLKSGPTIEMLVAGYDDSDDEDMKLGGDAGLKVETETGLRFCDIDISGVRIFEKDVIHGRI